MFGMSSQNTFVDAYTYPSDTVEDYFKVSAFVLAGLAGLIYALEFSFKSLRKNQYVPALHTRRGTYILWCCHVLIMVMCAEP